MPSWTHLHLVRHGSTSYTEQGRVQGQRDIPLSPQGIREAQATAAKLQSIAGDGASLSRGQASCQVESANTGMLFWLTCLPVDVLVAGFTAAVFVVRFQNHSSGRSPRAACMKFVQEFML